MNGGKEGISRHGPRLALHLAVRILGMGSTGGGGEERGGMRGVSVMDGYLCSLISASSVRNMWGAYVEKGRVAVLLSTLCLLK